jgi:hypothetical protein
MCVSGYAWPDHVKRPMAMIRSESRNEGTKEIVQKTRVMLRPGIFGAETAVGHH